MIWLRWAKRWVPGCMNPACLLFGATRSHNLSYSDAFRVLSKYVPFFITQARIGPMIAPYVADLKEYNDRAHLAVYGIMALFAA